MNIIDELKWELQKKDNALIKLILVNIIVFFIVGILSVISFFSGNNVIYEFTLKNLGLASSFTTFIYKPWTILTYAFVHSLGNIFHILFNLLTLYWFGRILADLIGSKKLLRLYFLGAICGGVLFLLIYNVAIFYLKIPPSSGILIGASGAVYAIVVAAATLSPNYIVRIFFTWDIKIVYIAIGIIFLSFIGTTGSNAGGNFAHLGGAIIGFFYIKLLKNGVDLAKPFDYFFSLFDKKKSPIKVSYKNKNYSGTNDSPPNEKELNDILDKISKSGYESLSKEEKQKLFKASQK